MSEEDAPKEFHFMDLPESLHIKVMANLPCATKLKLSESCTYLHDLLWSSARLSKDIRLNFNRRSDPLSMIKNLHLIQENRKRGRKYKKLKIYQYSSTFHPTVLETLIETFSFIGKSVEDLAVDLAKVESFDIIRLLRCFPSVEKLLLDGFFEDKINDNIEKLSTSGILMQLKELNVDHQDSMILKIIENVNTLERFTYQHSKFKGDFEYGVNKFEDFLIKQNGLKELKIYGMENSQLFVENRLAEISFQLENLFAACFFMHRSNIVNFLDHQKNIRNLHLIFFFHPQVFHQDRPSYSNILRKAFTLPKLENLIIGYGETILPEDFEFLSDIRNKSVKTIDYFDKDSLVVENFLLIFPSLEKLDFDGLSVKFTKLSSQNLKKLKCPKIIKFTYDATIETDRESFESDVIEFIKRHTNIKNLTIGSINWIGTSFELSSTFLSQIVEILTDLRTIEIYNPVQLDKSITLLKQIQSHKIHI